MGERTKHEFQAETQQLLDIVVHSIYTDREIFVRELVSNAADALEKARFVTARGDAVFQADRELKVTITPDEETGTLTFEDSGVGMGREELIENLGRIAHSGSKAFLKNLAENQKGDANLIGQFGVGFYSAFMVAKMVEVTSRSANEGEKAWKWVSEGAGDYEIEEVDGDCDRGTRIVLTLKDDAKEFAEKATIERVIKQYSNFVGFPIFLGEDKVNTVDALWSHSKGSISDEDYEAFYKFVANAYDAPRYRFHFTADAPLAIQSLLFVPQSNFEKMGMGRLEPGVNLYCKKVLIENNAPKLFPEWLRFLKGVVDSEDLPLSVSRESMQDSALMAKLNKTLTGRFLKFLGEQAKKDPEAYLEFFQEFGRYLREGIATDFEHREALAKLLRYETSGLDPEAHTSLAEYVERMKSDQEEIYFLVGPDRDTIEKSPYLEAMASKGLEVLYLYDPWDEFVMDHLGEFDGKKLVSCEQASVEADSAEGEGLTEEGTKGLCEWIGKTLGEEINEARASTRLVDSPAVVVDSEQLTSSMRRMMKAMNPGAPAGKIDFEINPKHAIIQDLEATRAQDEGLAETALRQLLLTSRAAAGMIEDPRTMVAQLNQMVGLALKGGK